ncbi:hypothetical protein [Halapricum salinum]|nr:hypothetical protein [Halapricum salinum]
MLTVTAPILSLVGVPPQYAAGGVSVVFFVAFWAVGLDYVLDLGIIFGDGTGES